MQAHMRMDSFLLRHGAEAAQGTAAVQNGSHGAAEHQTAGNIQKCVLLDEQRRKTDHGGEHCRKAGEEPAAAEGGRAPNGQNGPYGAHHVDGGEHIGVGVNGISPAIQRVSALSLGITAGRRS